MEAQRPQSSGGARGGVAAADRGAVETAPEPRAEHIIVAARVVPALSEASERACGDVGERERPRLPALRRPFDAGAHGTVDDHPPHIEVDVLPAQREQFAETHPGVGRNAVELPVLAVLPSAPLPLLDGHRAGRGRAMRARLGGTRERLDLLRLVEVEHRRGHLPALGR